MLIGLVLKTLFAQSNPLLIGAVTLFMLSMAGYEVMARQQRRFKGLWGMGIGTLSMFISSFSITLLALHVVVQVEPWYAPQYLIPLLGMLLGNTMTGMAIALDNLTQQVWQRRGAVEAKLTLGWNWDEAITDIRRDALRAGLIPIINAMGAAGVVSLPGMMTGQILAGSPPMEAARESATRTGLIRGSRPSFTKPACIPRAMTEPMVSKKSLIMMAKMVVQSPMWRAWTR